MNGLSSREWILIFVCASLLFAVFVLLVSIVIGLLVERIYIGRRLEGALQKLSLVQVDLFVALGNAYRSVEHSHKMVMRVMRVVDQTLGVALEKEPDEGWASVIGEREDSDDGS